MKFLFPKRIVFVMLMLPVLFSGCQKEIEFGEIQTDFDVETIYQAATNGILTVRFSSNQISAEKSFVKVFADFNEEPTILIGETRFSTTMSLPITKADYWKVVKGESGVVRISFTPLVLE